MRVLRSYTTSNNTDDYKCSEYNILLHSMQYYSAVFVFLPNYNYNITELR